MKKLPKARSNDITVQNLNNETLVYDLLTNKAYCLNETSSIIFNACDGVMTFAELKKQKGFSDELIFLALDELKKQKLVEGNEEYVSPFAGMNRREVIRRVGLTSMIALPMISSLIAPRAIHAGSVSGACIPIGQCRDESQFFCPSGCTETITLVTYGGTAAPCTDQEPGTQTFDCSDPANQGQIAGIDHRRVS